MTIYRYKIVKKIDHNLGEPFAEFLFLEDAHLFVQKKIEEDAKERTCTTYYIFDDEEMLDELQGVPVESNVLPEKKRHTVFNPTPLNMTPKPPSVLPDFLIETEEEDDSKNKE